MRTVVERADFSSALAEAIRIALRRVLLVPAIAIARAAIGTLVGDAPVQSLQRHAAQRAVSSLWQEQEVR